MSCLCHGVQDKKSPPDTRAYLRHGAMCEESTRMQCSSSQTVDEAPGPQNKPHVGPLPVPASDVGHLTLHPIEVSNQEGSSVQEDPQLSQGLSGPQMVDVGIQHAPGAGFPLHHPPLQSSQQISSKMGWGANWGDVRLAGSWSAVITMHHINLLWTIHLALRYLRTRVKG